MNAIVGEAGETLVLLQREDFGFVGPRGGENGVRNIPKIHARFNKGKLATKGTKSTKAILFLCPLCLLWLILFI
jgi:hypothetical protein